MAFFDKSEYQTIIDWFGDFCQDKMNKPNMFIIPCDSGDPYIEKIRFSLEKGFSVDVFEKSFPKHNLFNTAKYQNNLSFKCIVIDSGKSEKIRDVIKEVLWPTNNNSQESPTLCLVLSGHANIHFKPFNLLEYGIFVPYKTKEFSEIRTHSFNHKPVFYRYRVAVEKVEQLPVNLKSFLQLLFTDCPNHLFQKSYFRASARKGDDYKIEVQIEHSQEHELTKLAVNSQSFNQFKSRHENLQKYFLLNDPCTVACEVPVWLESNELRDYSDVFHTEDTLTGHIDVLRYEKDRKIGVWDYKPGASQEIDSAIQVFLYALMLSVRSGISLKNFVCGYFDETDAFLFNPSKIISFRGQPGHSKD